MEAENCMHLLRTFLVACCASFAVTFGVHGQQALSPMPPNAFQFTGRWDCEGSFRNGQVHKSAFTGAITVGGKWLELTEQDVQPATGYVAKYLIGYDAEQNRLVEFDANNFSAATYSSDEGWKGGVLTMTSAIAQSGKAPYVANRFLYSIAGQDSFTVDWQISKTQALDWVQADHLACRRHAGA
jgi:hypothetical protein